MRQTNLKTDDFSNRISGMELFRPVMDFLRCALCKSAMVLIILGTAGKQSLPAQDSGYFLSPAVASGDDGNYALGLRWGLDLMPKPRINPSLNYPSELWYELKLNGTVLTNPDVNVDPVGQVFLDFGWRVSLSSQRPFDMQHPDRDLLRFDLGYLFFGFQGHAGADQAFDEGLAGIGAVIHYRRLGMYRGLRPLIPGLMVSFSNKFPLMSQAYDMQGVDLDFYRQFDLGASWSFRSVYAATPDWFNNLRWVAGLNYFHRYGLEPQAEEITDVSGINYHFDMGYELSGHTRFLNYIFIRYSEGKYPVLLVDRHQWMIGITIGNL